MIIHWLIEQHSRQQDISNQEPSFKCLELNHIIMTNRFKVESSNMNELETNERPPAEWIH